MDGGRRLLRSITRFSLGHAVPAAAGLRAVPAPASAARLPAMRKQNLPQVVRPSERRVAQGGMWGAFQRALARPGAGIALTLLVIGGSGAYGAIRGGHYASFVASNGGGGDFLARAIGFGISAVVISSDNGMGDGEILKATGVTSNSSLLFLDVAAVREKLKSVPLIKEASVRKLFPDRLVINVEERQAFALWQKDGKVAVISADGTAIDEMRDDRFAGLPFVVGEGANLRIAEFSALLQAAGDMRTKIRAGVLVSGRRWNLKLQNDVTVMLPETAPEQALAQLAVLDHDARATEKDVVSLDLRQQGRMIVHLGAEAAAARAELMASRKRPKGGQT